MKALTVNTSHPYNVKVGKGLLSHIADEIAELYPVGRCMIISDDIVWALYGEGVRSSLSEAGYTVSEAVFPHGEDSKNMDTVMKLLEYASQAQLSRSDFVIALGGGIVGDVTGFVASIYLRGIDFIQIPTTLLSAIDSSVGGKTGVNSSFGKNLIGAFHQPKKVICDTDTFLTLPRDIYTAGICEALKYGVIADECLFETISDENADIEEWVFKCISIKAQIVENDEFDHGQRQLLNLGHTFGHAIEALSCYSISHGHAVGMGMLLITRAAEERGLCQRGCADKIKSALEGFSVAADIAFSPRELCSVAINDKKRKGDNITLVLPEKMGKCILHTIELSKLEEFISL